MTSPDKAQDPAQIPWDPHCTRFPARQALPPIARAPEGAAWVWGPDDQLGRLNLLTPARVAAAAATIATGEAVRVDLPLDEPAVPAWQRAPFRHTILVERGEGGGVLGHDDTYALNTQSGTQWDGFRHVSYGTTGLFYNGTTPGDITGPAANDRIGIGHWSARGLAGRAVLLDYRAYAEAVGIRYDAAERHVITYDALVACGRHQDGLDIRPASQGGDIQVGDVLLVRAGFVQDYRARTADANAAIGRRTGRDIQWAGVAQEPAVLDWLHDCYFAAVAGDAPAFEAWPTDQPYKLHEHLLALWGVPIGEMLDLEAVAALAARHRRWTFFFCTAPANCPRGVGSHVNGTVIF